MDDGIVLDRKSFEALAVESRVRILKSLRERRKTLSELADGLGMSVSGVKEHLQVLEQAGLIAKMDDGHKWKYYELTKKGSDVVAPKELRVWILLSISAVALIMSVMAMLYAMQPALMQEQAAAQPDGFVPAATAAPMLKTTAATEPENRSMNAAPSHAAAPLAAQAPGGPQESGTQTPGLDQVPLAVAVVSALTLAGCLLVLWRNRSRAAT